MANNETKLNCPLANSEIPDGICFDISMVAEDLAPIRTIDEKISAIKNFKKICLNCKLHRFD